MQQQMMGSNMGAQQASVQQMPGVGQAPDDALLTSLQVRWVKSQGRRIGQNSDPAHILRK
jgi:hypothetical protein